MDRTNQIIKLHHITNELMVMMQRLNEIHTSVKNISILKDQDKLNIINSISLGCNNIAEAYSKIKFK
jgi:hypothetical protein